MPGSEPSQGTPTSVKSGGGGSLSSLVKLEVGWRRSAGRLSGFKIDPGNGTIAVCRCVLCRHAVAVVPSLSQLGKCLCLGPANGRRRSNNSQTEERKGISLAAEMLLVESGKLQVSLFRIEHFRACDLCYKCGRLSEHGMVLRYTLLKRLRISCSFYLLNPFIAYPRPSCASTS